VNPDTVNGLFELVGGAFMFLNVRRVCLDKCVRGVSWPVMVFFTAWGWWNLYFYPAYGLWMSFWGGVLIVIGNTTWLTVAGYYIRRERKIALAKGVFT
jgi:hypothetical protein